MTDHDRESVNPESDPTDPAEIEVETEAEIDGAAPEELDAVVDALPGSGKLGTSHDDLDDAAGGPMQVP